MTAYLLKIILCSTLFALVYKVLFEKEKMPRFNRFYLLTSLGLSMLIPFLTIKHEVQLPPAVEHVTSGFLITTQSGIPQQAASSQDTNIIQLILLTMYVLISLILLVRFVRNLMTVLRSVRTNSTVPYHHCKIILIDQKVTPHSFLNYIFINRDDYNKGNVENEVLLHEMAHAQQKHSLDILFVESLQILFWFNPILYIYRNALLLNHEFLADEAVLDAHSDVSAYQLLLLEKASLQTSSFITNKFNYSITKKRLLMMTKRNSFRIALCKQLAVVPVLGIALFFFSTKTIAQDSQSVVSKEKISVPSTQEGISKEELLEYQTIANKLDFRKGVPASNKVSDVLSESEMKRLNFLYLSMSKVQQDSQRVVFLSEPAPFPKIVPTKEQMESWKDAKTYGLWINGKKVNNAALSNYSNTDFASVHISRLAKNARKNVKYLYQVNLMTTEQYAEYLKKNSDYKGKYILFIRTQASPLSETYAKRVRSK